MEGVSELVQLLDSGGNAASIIIVFLLWKMDRRLTRVEIKLFPREFAGKL